MISAITEIQFMLSRDWLAHARSDGHTCKIPRNEVLKCSADFARIMYVSCEWLSKLFLLWIWSRRITPIIWTPRSKGTPRSKRPAGSYPQRSIWAENETIASSKKLKTTSFSILPLWASYELRSQRLVYQTLRIGQNWATTGSNETLRI